MTVRRTAGLVVSSHICAVISTRGSNPVAWAGAVAEARPVPVNAIALVHAESARHLPYNVVLASRLAEAARGFEYAAWLRREAEDAEAAAVAAVLSVLGGGL